MTQLSGSLDGFGLGPILRLLGNTSKSGRVRVSRDRWTAEIYLEDGQVVAAGFGEASGVGGGPSGILHGLAALEAVALLMPHATFFFAEGVPRTRRDVALKADELQTRLAALAEECATTDAAALSLSMVPRHASRAEQESVDENLSIDRTTLRLLVSIDGRRSVGELVGEQDLLPTFRGLRWLATHGLILLPKPDE